MTIERFKLPETLTLNYRVWRCGSFRDSDQKVSKESTSIGSNTSCLLDSYSKRMCCLGQFSMQAGVPKNKLENNSYPCDIDNVVIKKLSKINNNEDRTALDTKLSLDAVNINDSELTTIAEKVVKLRELFGQKRHGSHKIELKNFPKCILKEVERLENV